jgi:hypothetical protein
MAKTDYVNLIDKWWGVAKCGGASHFIVYHDEKEDTYYASYVFPKEHVVTALLGGDHTSLTATAKEVYCLTLPLDPQKNDTKAWNID